MSFSRPNYSEISAKRREANLLALTTPSRAVVRGTYAGTAGAARPKENVCRSPAYENLVRALPCIRCGQPPRSQFCHADEGKGMGIKTDVRRGWPGCAYCHFEVGTSGTIPREQKRALEERYGRETRAAIVNAGTWPKRLPLWGD